MSEEKDLQLHRATLAEQAERYDDMAKVSSASLEIKWTFSFALFECVCVCVCGRFCLNLELFDWQSS